MASVCRSARRSAADARGPHPAGRCRERSESGDGRSQPAPIVLPGTPRRRHRPWSRSAERPTECRPTGPGPAPGPPGSHGGSGWSSGTGTPTAPRRPPRSHSGRPDDTRSRRYSSWPLTIGGAAAAGGASTQREAAFEARMSRVMTSRERLQVTLDHSQPDRVCVDVGGTFNTGMHAATVSALRRAILGESEYRVKVLHPIQINGEIDGALRRALSADVAAVMGNTIAFDIRNEDWKPWQLFDGTPVLVPGAFNPTVDAKGDLLMYTRGDSPLSASARMPRGGFYLDPMVRQQPIDEDRLDPADNCQEFVVLNDEEVTDFADRAERLATATEGGGVGLLPGG